MKNLTQEEIQAIGAAIKSKTLRENHKRILSDLLDRFISTSMEADLFVDGASDLHSGTAGIGGAVYIDGKEVTTFSIPLKGKTNNEAEYLSVIKGVKVSRELNIENLNIYSDSQLVVRQINGQYKLKNDRMKILNEKVMNELKKMTGWTVNHVEREKNKRADALSKQAMRSIQNTT
tara:strand:- start:507 stop:1034 length:528 start_codon:yes stop_codon:yes gene_type:complete